jgi:hypothetical protein
MPRANRRHTPVQSAAVVPSALSVSVHERRASKLEASERTLLKSVERGEWTTVARLPAAKARYARDARATLRHLRQA